MSNKVVIGSFPKQICYVSGAERTVSIGCEWDIDYGNAEKDNETKTVTPAFPADNNDPKNLGTATSWAKSSFGRDKVVEPPTKIVDNDFISGVRILSLEYRGNGGRAYKALVDNYYVDVREDVVLDTMMKEGIDPGGVLRGEFKWAKCGAQMKLVRKGSELFKLIEEFESKKDLKPVSKKSLDIGGVYRTKKKESYIYLGNVSSTQLSCAKLHDSQSYYSRDDDNTEYFDMTASKVKNMMLFFHVYKHQTLEEGVEDMKERDNHYRLDLKKSHILIEKVDQLTLDDDIVNQLAIKCASEFKDYILEYLGKKEPKKNHGRATARYLSQFLNNYSPILNMYLSNEKSREVFDIQKYLLFS